MKTLALLIALSVSAVAATFALPTPAAGDPVKIAVVVMENKDFKKIVNNAQAPYINSLIAEGKLLTSYAAITSGSLHNYLAMTSGLISKLSPPSDSVFQAIDGASGVQTWTEFEESMSANCGAGSVGDVPGTSTPLYTHGHDPAFQYKGNETCKVNDVPMTTTTFPPASLPDLSLIIPNQCDDMHTLPPDGSACPAFFGDNTGSSQVQMGDNWLRQVVPPLLEAGATVVLTWDEGKLSSGEHIATIVVGTGVTEGTDGTAYDHYGLEAGMYAALGLGTPPNNGASATPVPIP